MPSLSKCPNPVLEEVWVRILILALAHGLVQMDSFTFNQCYEHRARGSAFAKATYRTCCGGGQRIIYSWKTQRNHF